MLGLCHGSLDPPRRPHLTVVPPLPSPSRRQPPWHDRSWAWREPLQRIVHLGPSRGSRRDVRLLDLEVDLLSEHRDLPGRVDTDPYLLANDREDSYLDVVPDHDRLVGLACQNEHGPPPCLGRLG